MTNKTPVYHDHFTPKVTLTDPVSMPDASGFLWNRKMMLQMNCRGYATSQFMQPEPAKYANGPVQEAGGFMQPEPHYFSHHPGRFFYVRESGQCFSLPYEPMRVPLQQFAFSQLKDAIEWRVEHNGIRFVLTLRLPVDQTIELWKVEIENMRSESCKLEFVPHFSIGYMSWMNQSAEFDASLDAIVAQKITPYQKIEDYYKQQHFAEMTFLATDQQVKNWCASSRAFEGEGGLHNPDALKLQSLGNQKALYEIPSATLMHDVFLSPGGKRVLHYVFGAARDKDEIKQIKADFLDNPDGFERAAQAFQQYLGSGEGCISVKTPEPQFDQFINTWLPRQVFYHGDVNRLTTDPQTRNFLQDHMGMIYLDPERFPSAMMLALSQQKHNGAMPDGILLNEQAELKYINQVPHSDHCVWLPLSLNAYLNETGDKDFLNRRVAFQDSGEEASVFQHLQLAMGWLLEKLDARNLSLIAQGDWCDPMNMVGHQGKGVSCWLSLATVWAFSTWGEICRWAGQGDAAENWEHHAQSIRQAVNEYLWDGNWYARGINDDGRIFGVSEDQEGRIYLNPQSWSLLSETADNVQQELLLSQVSRQLDTPFGFMMLAPAYTRMDEGIGRLTQKFPGVAENGAVYNHAAAFFIFSLYQIGRSELAFEQLRTMLITQDNLQSTGQLPVFIPNYYRGAFYQHPEAAGRSSQLFNTGTVAWLYRTVVEQLFGIKGDKGELVIEPQLPAHWPKVKLARTFRQARFNIEIVRTDTGERKMWVDGTLSASSRVTNIQPGANYQIRLEIPHLNNGLKDQ